jgi:ribosomal protein S26
MHASNNDHLRTLPSPIHLNTLQDKAVKRFIVKNMIENAAQRDLKEASVYEVYAIPKMYLKTEYCISCAIHSHIVRCRSTANMKIRTPPVRQRQGEPKPNTGKPLKGLKKSKRRPVIYDPNAEDNKI